MMPYDDDLFTKSYDSRLMRRLLAYLRPHRVEVFIAVSAIAGHSLMQLGLPYLTKLAIDRHIMTGSLNGLEEIIILCLVLLSSCFVLEYIETYTMQMMGQKIMFDLRMEIYRHLQHLDLRFYDTNPVGRLMTRVTTDVDALNELFSSGVISIFRDVVLLVGIMILLLWMDWRLALVAFSVLPLIMVVTHWFRKNARESYRKVRFLIARINTFLQENITGMATVQLFRQEKNNFDKFDSVNQAHRDANIDSIFYYATFYPTIEFIGALATALIIWFGGGWSLQGTLTLGALVAFLQYSQRFFRPISDLSEKFNILQSAMASSERIFDLLDTPVRSAKFQEEQRPSGGGRIVFENVWFAYNNEDYILRDVSFAINPGERVGIVGSTGAGKTTLINLLFRFYEVNKGRITIDGIDIRSIPLDVLRERFGLVLQDVFLFSGTVRENIAIGKRSIEETDLRAIVDSVNAKSFIDQLPGGLGAELGERGATLSSGQKQLLSFARALVSSPKVLILDEATSNIDTETELLIQEALHRLMSNRTTLAIAHRLSTVQDMDRILVFHKGKLRESGSHQELLTQRGLYFKLYQLQYKDQETDSSFSVMKTSFSSSQ
tara:strand:- start:3203 stop:5017 length:1815 start_codon:yes stop_codon:yes gene_type:complete